MTKDIIKLSATLLGLDDVVKYLSDDNYEQVDAETQEKINQLIVYLNYCIREITKEYLPLKHSQTVKSDNQCQIYFNDFEQSPISILDIKNGCGLSVTFNLYPEFAKVGVPDNNYYITYNYVPKPIHSLTDKLVLPLGLDYFVVAYGVASEYALSKLQYAEAELWESKFKKSLENIKSHTGEKRMFARRLK